MNPKGPVVYTRRPVKVEAMRLSYNSPLRSYALREAHNHDIYKWIESNLPGTVVTFSGGEMTIITEDGRRRRAAAGSWVVRGENGYFEVLSDKDFHEKYEIKEKDPIVPYLVN